MKIPEQLRIPALVFTLQAALLDGCALIFRTDHFMRPPFAVAASTSR